MPETFRAPNVPIHQFKRTKIIATIGPATNSYELILRLIKAGANGIRLNFSHGTYDERIQQIKWIRKASKEYDKPVAIIQDLQGPKIRLGDFDGVINIQTGQSLQFKLDADYERSGIIPLQYDISKKVARGHSMHLFDGRLLTKITSVRDGVVHARAENSGILVKRKGINLPDTDFGGDIITDKDKKDISFGSAQDIDYVALSFVQKASDIEALKRKLKSLGSNAHIIAKIETKAGVENIDEIMEEADAIMIARGDMAVEIRPESVPLIQRKIIGLGLYHKKPTIVATQMLDSMNEDPEPTRAEVSDVATAVIVGADCVMLSDETASGKYPIKAVETMKKVIKFTQENSDVKAVFPNLPEDSSRQHAISTAIIDLAESMSAKAIVAETKSGSTAVNISSRRAESPIIAVTSDRKVTNRLAIVYGVKTYLRPIDKYAASKLTNWLVRNKVLKTGDIVVSASGKHPGVVGTTDTIKVRVL